MSNHLWRVAADGASPPERLEAAGFARLPATASVWQSRRFHALALRRRHQSVRAGRTGAGPAHIDLPGYEPAVLARRPAHRVQFGADCRNAGDLGRRG